MNDPEVLVARWHAAGLLTSEQSEAILAFERAPRQPPGAMPPSPSPTPTSSAAAPGAVAPPPPVTIPAPVRDTGARQSVAVEAIGYVGGALAVGAIALILGEVWTDLVDGARLSLLLLVTLLLSGAGLALRRVSPPPLQRLSTGLLTAAVGGVAWSVTTLTSDIAAWRSDDVTLAASLAATAVAVVFYRVGRRGLLQVAMLVALASTVVVGLARPVLDLDPAWFGLSLWTLGAAWFLLGIGGWLHPRRLAAILGALLALAAVQGTAWSGAGVAMLVLGVATAAALIAFAVASGHVDALVVGALGLFVLVPQLVFRLFGGAIGAPATLLVVGLVLVLVAVGLGRAHRQVATTQPQEVGR